VSKMNMSIQREQQGSAIFILAFSLIKSNGIRFVWLGRTIREYTHGSEEDLLIETLTCSGRCEGKEETNRRQVTVGFLLVSSPSVYT
jgi:hypothetical protein